MQLHRIEVLTGAALCAGLILGIEPAHAASSIVSVPIGDWIQQATGTIASACIALLSWAIARWLPSWARMQLTEQVLSRAVDYALGAVAGATKGKVLELPVANAVLAEAMTYAIAHAPTLAGWLGETLEPKLIARLSAAGVLPETASVATLGAGATG